MPSLLLCLASCLLAQTKAATAVLDSLGLNVVPHFLWAWSCPRQGVLCYAVNKRAAGRKPRRASLLSARTATELALICLKRRWRNVLCILLPFPLSYRATASLPRLFFFWALFSLTERLLIFLLNVWLMLNKAVEEIRVLKAFQPLTRGRWVLINIFYIPRLNFLQASKHV